MTALIGATSFLVEGAQVLDEAGSFTATRLRVVDGVVVADGPALARHRDEPVLDLAGHWLMPGIFDVHVHAVTHSHDGWELLNTSYGHRILQTAAALRRYLEAGVTFLRDAGGLEAGVARAVTDGLVPGPELATSVVALARTGGHGDGFLVGPGRPLSTDDLQPDYPGRPDPQVDGVDQVVRAVRQVVRAGADWVKMHATGGVMSAHGAGLTSEGPDDVPAEFTAGELAAAITEARRLRCPTMVHALGGPAIETAVSAGARSVEHGVWLTERDAALMAERGTWLVPTLAIYHHLAGQASAGALPEPVAARATAVAARLGEAVRIARAAGVRIAVGSDAAHRDHHATTWRELPLLHTAGLSIPETLLAATRSGAELCGVGHRLGALAPGHRFDAVALSSSPEDLEALATGRTVARVFQAGRTVHDRTHSPLPENGSERQP